MASSIQPSWAAISVRHCWRGDFAVPLHRSYKGTRKGSGGDDRRQNGDRLPNLPFIIKKFQFILCANWRSVGVTFRVCTAPTRCHLMALNRIHTHFGRLLAVWIAVAGLMAAEHHGTIKSGGLPVPGASVTAIKGDKKLFTTTDENGRYAFADLADGSWTIEVEMLGFAKLSNEVGIAFDAPAPEWNLKFLSMSAITAAAATPAAANVATAAKPAAAWQHPRRPRPIRPTRRQRRLRRHRRHLRRRNRLRERRGAAANRRMADAAPRTDAARTAPTGRPSLLQARLPARGRELLGRSGGGAGYRDWRPAKWPTSATAPTPRCWSAAASAAAWICPGGTIGSAARADAWTAWAARRPGGMNGDDGHERPGR